MYANVFCKVIYNLIHYYAYHLSNKYSFFSDLKYFHINKMDMCHRHMKMCYVVVERGKYFVLTYISFYFKAWVCTMHSDVLCPMPIYENFHIL